MGYMSPDMPEAPDPYTDYMQGYQAQIETYPQQRAIEAAARTGGVVTVNGRVYDFSGKGDADYQAQYSARMAQSLLDLQKRYGSQYVDQYLKELEMADPEGVAMRRQLWQDIKGDVGRTDERRALAEATQQKILAELEKGATLDPEMEREITQATKGRQTARGIIAGPATNLEEAGDLVTAGNAVKAQRQQRALEFLTSGKTPEDIAYQNRQQAMGNIGAFIAGETPVAQFGQLQGANDGMVPFVGGGPGVGMNQNAGQQAMQYNNSIWQTNTGVAGQQANPYLSGISLGFQGMALASAWGNNNSGTNYTDRIMRM